MKRVKGGRPTGHKYSKFFPKKILFVFYLFFILYSLFFIYYHRVNVKLFLFLWSVLVSSLSLSLSLSLCRFDIGKRPKISPDSFFLITPMAIKMISKKLRTKITLLFIMISLTIRATFILMGQRKISSLHCFRVCEFKNSLQFPPPLFFFILF